MVDAAIAYNAAAVVAYRDWYLICTVVNKDIDKMKQVCDAMNTAGYTAEKTLRAILHAGGAGDAAEHADYADEYDKICSNYSCKPSPC